MVGYVIASAIGSLMTFVAAAVIIRRNFTSLGGSGYRSALREFLPMAFHLNILATIKVIGANIDTLVIGALATTSQVGFYSIASGATSLLSLPIAPVSQVIFPELSEASARKDIKRVKYLINRFMILSAAISVVLGAALAIAANWLVFLLYDTEYGPVTPVIWVLLPGAILGAVFGWTRIVTVAAGLPQLNLFPALLVTVMRVVILIALVSMYGAIGAAIAYNIAIVVQIVANFVLILPQLGWWAKQE
jgi:O-antigen/teichoic acid export membrane protein